MADSQDSSNIERNLISFFGAFIQKNPPTLWPSTQAVSKAHWAAPEGQPWAPWAPVVRVGRRDLTGFQKKMVWKGRSFHGFNSGWSCDFSAS